jgi:hypothetical protein
METSRQDYSYSASEGRAPLTRREYFADALPGIVAVIFCMNWLPEPSPWVRALLSIIGGCVFQAGAMLSVFLVTALVAKVANRPFPDFPRGDSRLTGAALLAISIYILGTHWRTVQEDRIAACVKERIGEVANVTGAAVANLVHECALPSDDSYSNDE